MRGETAVALAVLLTACGGPPSRVVFQVRATETINPGPGGAANPAEVRMYVLSSATHLRNADYFALIDHEQAALDSDMLLRRNVIILPGGQQTVEVEVPSGATDVGVVVGFRDLDQAAWQASRPIPGNGRVPVLLDGRTVSLPEKLPPTDSPAPR